MIALKSESLFYYFNDFHFIYFLVSNIYMKNYDCDIHIRSP
jgi:hypothetical protein